MEGNAKWALIVAVVVVVVLIVVVAIWMCSASKNRKSTCMKPIDKHHQRKIESLSSAQKETVNLSRVYMMELATGSTCRSNTLELLETNYQTMYGVLIPEEAKVATGLEMAKYQLYAQLAQDDSRLPSVKQQLGLLNTQLAEVLAPESEKQQAVLQRLLGAMSSAYVDQLLFGQRQNCQLSLEAYGGATGAGELFGRWLVAEYGARHELL